MEISAPTPPTFQFPPVSVDVLGKKVKVEPPFATLDGDNEQQLLRISRLERNHNESTDEYVTVNSSGAFIVVSSLSDCLQHTSITPEKVIEIWNRKVERWKKLAAQPLPEEGALQEMRNRFGRLILLKEFEYPLFRHIFDGIPWENKVMFPDYWGLLEKKMGDHICGETTIELKGIKVPVEIRASVNRGHFRGFVFHGETEFSIHDPSKPEWSSELGHVTISTHYNPESDLSFDTSIGESCWRKPQEGEKLVQRRLFAFSWALKSGENKHIERLLTQIAVEVFAREAEQNILIIGAENEQASVLISGGLEVVGKDTEEKTAEFARTTFERIKHFREEGVLFPRPLCKFSSGTNHYILRKLPHFSGKVDYSLEKGPITWEQQIQKNPLLRGKGPILPKFYNEDYYKYEKGTI